MFRLLLPLLVLQAIVASANPPQFDLDAAPFLYRQRPLQDRFTRLKGEVESGRRDLDRRSEKAFLLDLLAALDVPVSSQSLVFSTTSLQLRLIRRDNPRALYFTDDVYVGFIPGGKIEIISIDPEVGGIFYIVDIPRGSEAIHIERSERCMNCHADEDTSGIPGLLLRSVAAGTSGGSLDTLRNGEIGHGVPFARRFGGWYLTAAGALTDHWGNAYGRFVDGSLIKVPVDPIAQFDPAKYPLGSSDLLPQLVQEHQAGFINRALHAAYVTRSALHLGGGRLSPAQSAQIEASARELVRYLLFADEVPLPAGGIPGSAAFQQDFLGRRVATRSGHSLRDFDLQQRLFRYRCSYMIYSRLFESLPSELKQRTLKLLQATLSRPATEYAYLPAEERTSILRILHETLPAFRLVN